MNASSEPGALLEKYTDLVQEHGHECSKSWRRDEEPLVSREQH